MSDAIRALFEEQRGKIAAHVAMFDRDIENRMYEQAALASAKYALEHMVTTPTFRGGGAHKDPHLDLLEHAAGRIGLDGFCAEFGVGGGGTLAVIANAVDRVVYGFDSFRGLREDWSASVRKGAFDRGGKPPTTLPRIAFQNVRLVQGWFEETIPQFTTQISQPAALIHLDCYLRNSAATVFELLGDRIVEGSILVIRQFFNYPGWERGPFEAFRDFCNAAGRTPEFIGFTPSGTSAALIVR